MMSRSEIEKAILEFREEKSRNFIRVLIASISVTVIFAFFIIIFKLSNSWEVVTVLLSLLSLFVSGWYFNRNIHKNLGLLCPVCKIKLDENRFLEILLENECLKCNGQIYET